MMRKLQVLVAMVAILTISMAAGQALAADKAQVLKDGAATMESLIGGAGGQAMMKKVGLYKEAGLSYQSSLVTPVKGIFKCKDMEQLRVLYGMYIFDANYALLFGKKKEFAAALELWLEAMPKKMKMAEKLKVKGMTAEEMKKVTDNPANPENRKLYAKTILANVQRWIAASATDPEMMDVLVDGLYGTAIQGLYIACKLGLGVGSGDKLVALFNEQANRLDKTQQIIAAYAADDKLAKLVERDQRQKVLGPVMALLKEKKGKLSQDDIKKVLALIEPERSALVKACK